MLAVGSMEPQMCGGAEPFFLPLLPAARLLISPAAEVVEGQAVTLSCRSGLSPTPDIRFSWYLNGALLLEGPSSSLLLPAATSSDAGSYHCRAQDGHKASGPSSPAVLTVLCEQPPHWPLPALGKISPLGSTSYPYLLQAHLTLSCPGSRSGELLQTWAPWISPPRAEIWGTRLRISLPPQPLIPVPLGPPGPCLKLTMGTMSKLCSELGPETPQSYICAHMPRGLCPHRLWRHRGRTFPRKNFILSWVMLRISPRGQPKFREHLATRGPPLTCTRAMSWDCQEEQLPFRGFLVSGRDHIGALADECL